MERKRRRRGRGGGGREACLVGWLAQAYLYTRGATFYIPQKSSSVIPYAEGRCASCECVNPNTPPASRSLISVDVSVFDPDLATHCMYL